MPQPIIKVEQLSKLYRLGEVGTGTLSHDLKRWWHKVRGKEDPFARIGEVNDRSTKGNSDYVWALKDLNFSVQPGEVVGIIGRNGAGKSTLLKILSKTTAPTTGRIKVRGRIASLLEVGTGFHPELTGRENIYLNGAILGMTRKEINRQFDAIVDFAGVERYVDTPVKRYSSGMYVRLAFAVAAHLEPEILIVDEVLAVGDAEFQKKCLGKMKDVSVNEGRTVLFVSHNMGAISNLCNSSILLENGNITSQGITSEVISKYMSDSILLANNDRNLEILQSRSGNQTVQFSTFHIENNLGQVVEQIFTGDDVSFVFNLKINKSNIQKISVGFSIHTLHDEMLGYLYSDFQNQYFSTNTDNLQYLKVQCTLPKISLAPGTYLIRGRIIANFEEADWPKEPIGILNIEMGDFYGNGKVFTVLAPLLLKGIWN